MFSANAFTPESVVSGVYALLPEPPGPPIPTLSQWWLITFAVLMLLTGATILRRRALPGNS